MLITAPVWPAQHWYPLLLQMLADFTLLLTNQRDPLRNPHQQCHPLIQNSHQILKLGAWLVSGIPCQAASFQKIISQLQCLMP